MSPPGLALRTSFSAASLASAPELVKNTPPPSDEVASRSASCVIGAVKYRLPTCIRRPAWSCTAETTCGWQWPTLETEMPDRKSRYSLCSLSHRFVPRPRTNSTGKRA